MRSGTEKRKNPCEAPLGQYLRALARPVTTRRLRVRKPQPEKFIHEPPARRQKTRPCDRKTKRRENMSTYDRAVIALRHAAKNGDLRVHGKVGKSDQLIAAWRAIWGPVEIAELTALTAKLVAEEAADGSR